MFKKKEIVYPKRVLSSKQEVIDLIVASYLDSSMHMPDEQGECAKMITAINDKHNRITFELEGGTLVVSLNHAPIAAFYDRFYAFMFDVA